MKFLVDAQLPPLLVTFLTQKGCEAVHVQHALQLAADDSTIWKFAQTGSWIIVTKDADFAARAARTRLAPQILWIRLGNISNSELLSALDRQWDSIQERFDAGVRLVELEP